LPFSPFAQASIASPQPCVRCAVQAGGYGEGACCCLVMSLQQPNKNWQSAAFVCLARLCIQTGVAPASCGLNIHIHADHPCIPRACERADFPMYTENVTCTSRAQCHPQGHRHRRPPILQVSCGGKPPLQTVAANAAISATRCVPPDHMAILYAPRGGTHLLLLTVAEYSLRSRLVSPPAPEAALPPAC